MKQKLEELFNIYPLLSDWKISEIWLDPMNISQLTIPVIGLCATRSSGEEVTASAAGISDETLLERAYFELIERMAVVDARAHREAFFESYDQNHISQGKICFEQVFPDSPKTQEWQYSKSNGVAAHLNWQLASQNALVELIERDLILRSWYGEVTPQKIDLPTGGITTALKDFYLFEAYSFENLFSICSAIIIGAIFGFPINAKHSPLIYGFSGCSTLEGVIQSASRECLQRLVFLWEEEMPETPSLFSPTADYHQDLFLLPSQTHKIKNWLHGEHRKYGRFFFPPSRSTQLFFLDLTPTHLKSKVFVAKAMDSRALALTFGTNRSFLSREFPAELLIHPVV